MIFKSFLTVVTVFTHDQSFTVADPAQSLPSTDNHSSCCVTFYELMTDFHGALYYMHTFPAAQLWSDCPCVKKAMDH